MVTERDHWLSITDELGWKRNHISDPNISQDETIDAIVSAFPDDNLERIVEIGCGYGRLTSVIAGWYPDATVSGIDINPAVLACALPGASYYCADHLTDFRNQDAIYSVALFQHLPHDEQRFYICEAADALRPGGVFRLQFIEGDRDNFCDHWTPLERMRGWFDEALLDVGSVDRGLAHPQWTWITGIK
jgi:trans-aconitate methyltransferase